MSGGALRDEPAEPVSIEGPPPLARMAALMALVDLFWNRMLVRAVASFDEDAGIGLMRAGVFPRNLAAVAGLVAFASGLFTFLRMAGYSGLGRRLAISSIAGLLMPAFVLALIIPKEQVSVLVVVVALVASNALAVLLGTVAIGYPGGARRWAAGLALSSGVLVLSSLVVAYVHAVYEWAGPLGLITHHTQELVWHAMPAVVLVALFRAPASATPSERPAPRPALLGLVGVIVVVALALALYGESRLHAHRFATLIYGAVRLTLLPDSLSWLNGLTLGLGLGAALVSLFSPSPARAQLGAAIALWLAAGNAPRAPGQLLDFALAVLLLARACQAVTREGRARARIPWSGVPAAASDP